eukprot:scaffold388_cov380-Prasinococcus_capsulatus_cf.AAC.2
MAACCARARCAARAACAGGAPARCAAQPKALTTARLSWLRQRRAPSSATPRCAPPVDPGARPHGR